MNLYRYSRHFVGSSSVAVYRASINNIKSSAYISIFLNNEAKIVGVTEDFKYSNSLSGSFLNMLQFLVNS